MLTEVILWNYCNVWTFPSNRRDCDEEHVCSSDGEWDAFERVMDKVRAGGAFTSWAEAQSHDVH